MKKLVTISLFIFAIFCIFYYRSNAVQIKCQYYYTSFDDKLSTTVNFTYKFPGTWNFLKSSIEDVKEKSNKLSSLYQNYFQYTTGKAMLYVFLYKYLK